MSDQNQPPVPPSGEGPGSPPPLPPQGPPAPAGRRNEWDDVASGAAQSLGDSLSGVGNPGFFAGLFDFSFSKFITTKVLGVLYALIVVALAIGWLVAVIGGFTTNVWLGLAALILGPIFLLVYLIFARITLEFYAAAIRTASNTGQLVEQGSRTR